MMKKIKISNCTICEELEGNHNVFDNLYQLIVQKKRNVIYRTPNFALLPSIGPINEHHLLIVPDSHFTSFSVIDPSLMEEFLELKASLEKFNKEKFGVRTQYFEHGSCIATATDSSCIEHAHLHCIGENDDLTSAFTGNYRFEPIPFSTLGNYTGSSYLLYINPDGRCFINNTESFPSQYFRKTYLEGKPGGENWNWRENPNLPVIEKIIDLYKDFR